MTTEEIVFAAAIDVASVMNPQLKKQEEEEFIRLFTKKAFELLEEKGNVFLEMCAYEEAGPVSFSKEMEAIMRFVEEKTKKKYSFYEGRLLIYFDKEQGTGIWER